MIYKVDPSQTITETTLDEILQQEKWTLLYFYPKNDTPGCTLEAQDFTRLAQDFAKFNIQIVWVSKDTAESHCRFIEKYTLTPTYLADPDLELHTKFATWGEKNNYGKIVMWVIRSTFLLDTSWAILHDRRSIKATWHADRVLKRVQDNQKELS